MSQVQGITKKRGVFAGIDVGSLTAKCVLINDEGILSSSIIDTGVDSHKAGKTVFNKALQNMGCKT